MLQNMRKMGIDFGSKNVGIALSDESGAMAFPHGVLPNNRELQKQIEETIEKEKVGEIVIGYSLDREGKENPIHKKVEELITNLTLSVGIPVHLEPEQYTTQQAIQIQGKNDQTDAAAAALILEGFLNKSRTGSIFDELNN